MARHIFIPFMGTDFICRKCGQVATSVRKMQVYINECNCIEDNDERCLDVAGIEKYEAMTLRNSKRQDAAIDKAVDRMIVAFDEEVAEAIKPTPEQDARFSNWLDSSDPIMDLFGPDDK